MAYPVTVDALHTVFSPYGFVMKITLFDKGGVPQVPLPPAVLRRVMLIAIIRGGHVSQASWGFCHAACRSLRPGLHQVAVHHWHEVMPGCDEFVPVVEGTLVQPMIQGPAMLRSQPPLLGRLTTVSTAGPGAVPRRAHGHNGQECARGPRHL